MQVHPFEHMHDEALRRGFEQSLKSHFGDRYVSGLVFNSGGMVWHDSLRPGQAEVKCNLYVRKTGATAALFTMCDCEWTDRKKHEAKFYFHDLLIEPHGTVLTAALASFDNSIAQCVKVVDATTR